MQCSTRRATDCSYSCCHAGVIVCMVDITSYGHMSMIVYFEMWLILFIKIAVAFADSFTNSAKLYHTCSFTVVASTYITVKVYMMCYMEQWQCLNSRWVALEQSRIPFTTPVQSYCPCQITHRLPALSRPCWRDAFVSQWKSSCHWEQDNGRTVESNGIMGVW